MPKVNPGRKSDELIEYPSGARVTTSVVGHLVCIVREITSLDSRLKANEEAICPRVAARLTALEKAPSAALVDERVRLRDIQLQTRIEALGEHVLRAAKCTVNLEDRIAHLESKLRMLDKRTTDDNVRAANRDVTVNQRLSRLEGPPAQDPSSEIARGYTANEATSAPAPLPSDDYQRGWMAGLRDAMSAVAAKYK